MHKFKFRLETLLKVRKMKEEKTQVILSAATQEYLKELEILNTLEQLIITNLESLRNLQMQKTDVNTLVICNQYVTSLKAQAQKQSVIVKQKELYRKQCIKDMEEAVKQRKVVEKLKQKRFEQFLDENQKVEQKFLDELALLGHEQGE